MIFQHYATGGLYKFIGLAVDARTCADVVIYEAVADGTTWTRPAEEFFGVVRGDINADGASARRFVLVPPVRKVG